MKNSLVPDANGVIYVKQAATGNGSSWENATGDLQMAINAENVQQVWVAGGTYLPKYRADNMSGADPNDRVNAFVLKKDIKVYGGFAGTETSLDQRDLSQSDNASILSGDLGTADENADNAYHVVISAGDAGTAELNGFTITGGGYSDTGSVTVTVNGEEVNSTAGGGMHNVNSSPAITHCIFSGNFAGGGGGIYNKNSSPIITHCIFSGNLAFIGGGLYNYDSFPVLTNVSIIGNTGSYNGNDLGGGIYNAASSSPVIRNSIIYGNNGGEIVNDEDSSSVISYSLVQGLTGTSNGNIADTDPLFVDMQNGDYHLQENSPAVNTGNNVYFDAGQTPDLSAITTDLEGNERIQGETIDLGAYESAYESASDIILSPDANGIIYVKQDATGNGSSWENATGDLQMAINTENVQQVWVAGGTYLPEYRADDMSGTNPNDRNNAFVLKKDIKVYGGFAGTETSLDQRDLSQADNASILSGDLGTADENTDNAYHVVISAGDAGTAELNGFTITNGFANNGVETITVNGEDVYSRFGGGVFILSSSPALAHLNISNNTAHWGGGVYIESSASVFAQVEISENTANLGGGLFIEYPTLLF